MASGAGASPPPRESRIGAIALVVMLVVALLVGIFVYRARTPDLALEVVKLDREVADSRAELTFFVRFDEPDATVEIVGRDLEPARVLAAGYELADERRVTCVWDGLDDDGTEAEPGRYRLRVTLPGQDRVMVYPRRITVTTAPRGASIPVFEPCSDGAEQ